MTDSGEIQVGSRVRLRTTSDPGEPESVEVGIVVHIYYNEEVQTRDAYIAFFGDSFPEGKPTEKPYVLRYFVSSLELIEDD